MHVFLTFIFLLPKLLIRCERAEILKHNQPYSPVAHIHTLFLKDRGFLNHLKSMAVAVRGRNPTRLVLRKQVMKRAEGGKGIKYKNHDE